jgi:predicted nucleic acid-binding protein
VSFLADTNLLLRSVDSAHPMHAEAIYAIRTLRVRGNLIHIVPQNLIEFWNVYTRPLERNGLGGTATEAKEEIERLKQFFPLLLDTAEVYQVWENLVVTYNVMGVNVHDARLVAAMLIHGLTQIVTFNTDDFRRYSEITAIHPAEIIQP